MKIAPEKSANQICRESAIGDRSTITATVNWIWVAKAIRERKRETKLPTPRDRHVERLKRGGIKELGMKLPNNVLLLLLEGVFC